LEAQVHFVQPLDDPSLKWLQWDWKKNAYAPFTPPAFGETVWTASPFDLTDARQPYGEITWRYNLK
jgi:hypothetical protein